MTDNKKDRQDRTIPEDEIRELLGRKAGLWLSLRDYLTDSYPDCLPVFGREGKDKKMVIRYRQSGRTLVTLYPDENSLGVLVVLGRKEVAKTEALTDELNAGIRELFMKTEQLHDGRWLWLKPSSQSDLDSIKLLLSTKRRPKSRS